MCKTAYNDQPERDSLDGNLPSSSVNTPNNWNRPPLCINTQPVYPSTDKLGLTCSLLFPLSFIVASGEMNSSIRRNLSATWKRRKLQRLACLPALIHPLSTFLYRQHAAWPATNRLHRRPNPSWRAPTGAVNANLCEFLNSKNCETVKRKKFCRIYEFSIRSAGQYA